MFWNFTLNFIIQAIKKLNTGSWTDTYLGIYDYAKKITDTWALFLEYKEWQ